MPDLLPAFGLIAIVLIVSALASGIIEKVPISFPIIFLGIGVLLGERVLGVITITSENPNLETIAIITLCLVLFLDAAKLQVDELGRQWLIPALILGPGTILIIGLISGATYLLFGLPIVASLMIGAALASTDPVVLRDIVRDSRLPRSVRQALTMEAGMNDLVVLPIALVLIAVAVGRLGDAGDWALFLSQLLLLGPIAGFVIGGAGSWLINKIDARTPIRREFQALYGIGLVFAAYATATALGGDGFLAAFFAGLGVVLLNQELCDCFLDYGETTSEMAMLLSFVLFGAIISSIFTLVALVPALIFAAFVVFVARPLSLGLVLSRAHMSLEARGFVAWFGPRALNSMLLALLVVLGGVPGGEAVLAIVGIVVVVSVVLHGSSATPAASWYARRLQRETLSEERETTAAGLFGGGEHDVERISPEEVVHRLAGRDPPILMDVRTRSGYLADAVQIPNSIRVMPDQVRDWVVDQPKGRPIVTYCT